MTGMRVYYVSRAVISAAFGALFAASGTPWWTAALMGAGLFAMFLWAPRSDRYAVHPEQGVTALRRDERTQTINDRAARNGFVASMLLSGGAAAYYGAIGLTEIPIGFLRALLAVGAVTYFAFDWWYRRA